jgi:hypothetical protein
MPSMSAGLRPASAIAFERGVGMQLDLRHVGDDAEVGGLGGADIG